MLVFPNAKINLGLQIKEKRQDGYHNIETVFFPIMGFSDALEFIPANDFSINCTGLMMEGNIEDNLVVRALQMIKDMFELPPLRIHLHKIIPSGAGLGGGSADAAFMLKALVSYFELPLKYQQMLDLAGKLGSDCPFFILNKPAFASARGDKIEPIILDLNKYHIVIVKPLFSVNTREAYEGAIPSKPAASLKELITLPLKDWCKFIHNDFEPFILSKYPELANIKNILYESGAIYASMSGSGSAIYGIYEEATKIKDFPRNFMVWKDN
jgi:4-diphosphocytidyl-2-C-methyl-D-erythritol kinase